MRSRHSGPSRRSLADSAAQRLLARLGRRLRRLHAACAQRERSLRIEDLPHLAIDHPLLVAAARVAGTTRRQKLTAAGLRRYSVISQRPANRFRMRSTAVRPMPSRRLAREMKNSAMRYSTTGRPATAAAGHHRKSNGLGGFENDQREGVAIAEPAGDLIRLTVTDFAQHREKTGAQRRQIIQIFAIDAPIQSRSLSERRASRTLTVTTAGTFVSQKERPGQFAERSVRAVLS